MNTFPRAASVAVLLTLSTVFSSCGDGGGGTEPEPTPSADVRLTKTAADDGSPAVGETVTYTLQVSNAGPSPATSVVVTDTLPGGVAFVSASGSGTESGGLVSWIIPSLASGASSTHTLTVTITAGGTLINRGSVTSATSDPSRTNNTDTAETVSADLADLSVSVTATDDGTPAVTETITYTLQVSNAGPSPATGIVVTDTLPGGVTFVSASGSGAESGGVVTWDTIPSLPSGADTVLTVSAVIASEGTMTNKAAVTSVTSDPSLANNSDAAEITAAAVSVTPSSGPPGTLLQISGLDLAGVEFDSLRVSVGGELAHVNRNASGILIAVVPLFLNQEGIPSPPAEPVDVVVKNVDQVLGSAEGAVTILPFPQAPGEVQRVAEEMEAIVELLKTITRGLGGEPGVEEQYLEATFAALDSVMNGSSEYSLQSALSAVGESASQTQVIDGLLKVIKAHDHLAGFSSELQTIADQLGALPPGASASLVGMQVSDHLLALKMQFYVILKSFGEQVIEQTGATFAEYVGTAAGAVGIVYPLPQVAVTLLILNYIDFVVNKVVVGLFPASLDAINLTLATNDLDTYETTSATIAVTASNFPPQISLQYMIGTILTVMGASGSGEAIQSFKDVLIETAGFFLQTMQSIIASYSQNHQELNLDVDLGSVVPHITWQAQATDPVFFDLKTFTPEIVEPLIQDLNWVTKDKVGIGRIYVMPSSSADARLLPGYYGGAFGIGSVASQVRSVIVGSNLELQVVAPGAMSQGETAELDIRAGYRVEGGGVNWTSGIEITIAMEDGSVDLDSGTTDDNGDFTTDIHADDADADEITIIIEAKGDNDTFAGTFLNIAVGKGLPAFYSNGAQRTEGPISHGWSSACSGDVFKNNSYQDACTPLSASPVNWASGGWEGEEDPTRFYVSWSGYLFAPVDGEYRFGGWFDGDVYIEVNGVGLVDEKTTGSSYSGPVYLTGETWTPIFVFFETNGGSNNMMLKWTVPGTGASEFVPRKYMNDEPGDETSTMQPIVRPQNVTVIRRF